jgi:hypothetical protein
MRRIGARLVDDPNNVRAFDHGLVVHDEWAVPLTANGGRLDKN